MLGLDSVCLALLVCAASCNRWKSLLCKITHTHACMRTHTHAHMRTHAHTTDGGIQVEWLGFGAVRPSPCGMSVCVYSAT